MNLIWILAKNVWLEQFRNRFFHLIWMFGGVLLYASFLLGVLAVEQELRVLQDIGLALIELLTLGAAVFVAANSILKEMELKTIYLILARPVPRGAYLLGRFLGLQFSVGTAALLMALLHVSLLLFRGWHGEPAYVFALGGILAKVFLMTALTFLLSLLSTSVLSALSMTSICWLLGHFAPELRILAGKSVGTTGALLAAVRWLLPDLQAFNLRDAWPPGGTLSWSGPAWAAVYLLLYSGACLAFAYGMFRRREF